MWGLLPPYTSNPFLTLVKSTNPCIYCIYGKRLSIHITALQKDFERSEMTETHWLSWGYNLADKFTNSESCASLEPFPQTGTFPSMWCRGLYALHPIRHLVLYKRFLVRTRACRFILTH